MDFKKIEELIALTSTLIPYTSDSSTSDDTQKLKRIAMAVNNRETGWLRTGERWNAQTSRFESNSSQIQQLAGELGFVDQVKVPSQYSSSTTNCHVFDRAIVLGAAAGAVKNRMKHLSDCWASGCRWKTLVLLGSDRSLDQPESDRLIKDKVMSANFEPTEMGMMKFVYYESLPNFPGGLQEIPVLFINATAKAANKVSRVDTQDTIVEWLKVEETSDSLKNVHSLLAISNQPYVKYQNEVFLNSLKKAGLAGRMELATVGQGTTSASAPLLLDSIARYLFMLDKNLND